MFGSNKNLSLGVGDEDDRQHPERISFKRPDRLLYRFYQSYLANSDLELSMSLPDVDEIPNLVRNRPLAIQDFAMSKFHTALLTTDPVCNLYVCGVGRGGRLGLGDENTQFKFQPVQGPLADKKVRKVALGQNHSMVVVGNGELWTWGLNSDSQLGYVLPPTLHADEEPMSLSPRQVFGSLKKETIQGIAASPVHSVAHTSQSLYCWGRNFGQLALMDADSRSLDVQPTPRKVAASLISAPIETVSAIEKATTCLLANGTVWVFTNYGYNLLKFAFPDVSLNASLSERFVFRHRYDQSQRRIRHITSGGETIAAVTGRGDLFTMHLRESDPRQLAGSTTNPVKIKDAVTKPQCIWDSKNDGVASVSVSENGSVIICTESGSVWRRVKRTKGKIASYIGTADTKRKDFKFERIPYITNCVAVQSSIFGAFAAIRRNNKIMSKEISIDKKSLWDDLASLLCLNDFRPPESTSEATGPRKAWLEAIRRERPGSTSYEILRSKDVESELQQWLKNSSFQYDKTDIEIRTTTSPDLRIPVHGWVLSARSPVLRTALAEFRRRGTAPSSDAFIVETRDGKILLTLLDIDIFTLLNMVVYSYQDSTVPVWKYTRDALSLAYRFRQVRSEIMKIATKLQMPKLESAARLQAGVDMSIDVDMRKALPDPSFFEDGDVLIQLDGEDIIAHSQLICQRCPFFEGMFHGRSGGQWLAGRQGDSSSSEKLSVDLKHIAPETFRFVLSFLYADVGEEMFNDVAMATIDEFSELVLDVMSVANELMLDRLSQICQSVIGKFATTRNIANLLNEISPCVVTGFKDAGLEYICLQLESMLENHLLDGLDEDLLQELDIVVRNNQLARLPVAKSGRAELMLYDKYPELAADIDEERQRRVKEMASKTAQHDERRLSSSYRARVGSLDETFLGSQTPDGTRNKSKPSHNEPFSPYLRPKESHGDMIFNMDEEDGSGLSNPMSPSLNSTRPRTDADLDSLPQLPEVWQEVKRKGRSDRLESPMSNPPYQQPLRSPSAKSPTGPFSELRGSQTQKSGKPWASPSFPTAKLDLRDIMSESSSKSALTASLAAQAPKIPENIEPQAKMSQKERKKQQQQQVEAEARATAPDEVARGVSWEKVEPSSRPTPWKMAAPAPKVSLQDTMASAGTPKKLLPAKSLLTSESSPQLAPRRTASPDTRFSGQGRVTSSPAVPSVSSQQQKKPVTPHSKSYIKPAPKAEPMAGATMADIIGQQKREQELVKEAVAVRSLQEIQQEQAFQEWWDQESRRAQEDETRRQARGSDRDGKRGGRGRGGHKGKPQNTTGRVTDGGVAGGAERGRRGGHGNAKGSGVKS